MRTVAFTLTAIALLQVAPPSPQPTETIAGTVTRTDTKAPLPHTRLELVREEYVRRPTGFEKVCKPESHEDISDLRQFATSDASGHFTFKDIIPGRYYLIAEHEGFLRTEYGQRGRFPVGTILPIGPQSERLFVASETEIARERTNIGDADAPRPSTATPPRGGLGREQQGLNAGANSALRDGTIEQTGIRGGLGREAARVTAGAESAISYGGNAGMPRNLLQNLSIAMIPAVTIKGTVLDGNGHPLAAASVQAYQFRYTPMNGRTLKSIRATLTDDNGAYRLFQLDPGRYVVAAGYSKYGLQPWSSALAFTPNLPNSDAGLPIHFYPASSSANDAIALPVEPGAEPVADLRLRERARLTVRVRLVGDSLPENAALVFVPYGGDLCAARDYGISQSGQATFEIRDVPEGYYVAAAMNGRDFISDLVTVKVERNAPLETSVPVAAPTEIQGTLYFNVVPKEIDLSLIRVNLTRTGQALSQVPTAVVDPATLRFSIPGVGPGSYYPSVDLPPGFYVENVMASRFDPQHPEDCSRDARATTPTYAYLDSHGHLDPTKPLRVPQTIPAAAQCLAIQVNFGLPVVGIVRDRNDKPVSGALVVGIPKSAWANPGDDGATPPDRYLTGATDNTGKFQLYGATEWIGAGTLARQEYHLYAFENIDPNMIYEPGFTERFRTKEPFVIRTEKREPGATSWRTTRIKESDRMRDTMADPVINEGEPSCPGEIDAGRWRQTCFLRSISPEETAGIR